MAEIPEKQADRVMHIREWVVGRARAFREAKGFTQGQVADRMDIHLSRVCDFELNRSDFKASTVFRYCAALGVSIEDFFKGAPKIKGGGGSKGGRDVIVISAHDLLEKMVSSGFLREDAEDLVKEITER